MMKNKIRSVANVWLPYILLNANSWAGHFISFQTYNDSNDSKCTEVYFYIWLNYDSWVLGLLYAILKLSLYQPVKSKLIKSSTYIWCTSICYKLISSSVIKKYESTRKTDKEWKFNSSHVWHFLSVSDFASLYENDSRFFSNCLMPIHEVDAQLLEEKLHLYFRTCKNLIPRWILKWLFVFWNVMLMYFCSPENGNNYYLSIHDWQDVLTDDKLLNLLVYS